MFTGAHHWSQLNPVLTFTSIATYLISEYNMYFSNYWYIVFALTSPLSNVAVEWLVLLRHIREVLSNKSVRVPPILPEVFCNFPNFLQANASGSDFNRPRPLPFIWTHHHQLLWTSSSKPRRLLLINNIALYSSWYQICLKLICGCNRLDLGYAAVLEIRTLWKMGSAVFICRRNAFWK